MGFNLRGLLNGAGRAAPIIQQELRRRKLQEEQDSDRLLQRNRVIQNDIRDSVNDAQRYQMNAANIMHTNAATDALRNPAEKPTEYEIRETDQGLVRVPKIGTPGVVYGPDGQPLRAKAAPVAQQHVVDPVTGEVKFFDPTKPPTGLKVNPAPKNPPQEPLAQVQNEDGSVEYVPRSQAIGKKAPNKAAAGSAALKKAVAANQSQLSVIDDALAELDRYPDAVGLKRGVADMVPFMGNVGDAINQRKDPQGINARAAISNIGSLVVHDRSGSAVTVSEFPRLAPFVPRVSDTPDAVRKKLAKLKQAIQTETSALDQQLGSTTPAPAPAGGRGGSRGAGPSRGDINLGAPTREQQLWDAAVQKHGRAKVEATFGPRPGGDDDNEDTLE